MRKIAMILLLLPVISFSQKQAAGKIKPHTVLSSGMIAGQTGVKPLFQLSGGIGHDRFFTGIGAGYDAYKFNTVPVFADWRINFGNKKVVFVYAHAGYNFPAGNQEEDEAFKISEQTKGGFYMDGGIGYRLPGILHRFSFSAGYSQKNVVQKKTYSFCGFVDCDQFTYTYRYNSGRIMIKAGWEFGK